MPALMQSLWRLLLAVAFGGFALAGCGGSGGSSVALTLQSIEINLIDSSIGAGSSTAVTATAIYSGDIHVDVTRQAAWSSSDAAVATVDGASGRVKGVAVGSAAITATLEGKRASTTLSVIPATALSLAMSPSAPRIAAGISQRFTATATMSDGSAQDLGAEVAWSSSNTAVATVDANGVASGVAAGTATITASCSLASLCGHLSASQPLAVTAATLDAIAVTPASATAPIGATKFFKATGTYSDGSTLDLTTSVRWASSTTSIATVSNDKGDEGEAKAVAAGTTQITATLGAVTSAPASLTVTAAALTSITLTPTSATTPLGIAKAFSALGSYSDGSTHDLTTLVTWASSAGSIATVSNAEGVEGLVTPLAVGTAQISASLGGIASPPATLTVVAATLSSITVKPANATLGAGLTQQYSATGSYSDGSTHDLSDSVTWSSSDSAKALIDNAAGRRGQALALRSGSSTVTATLGSVIGSTGLSTEDFTLLTPGAAAWRVPAGVTQIDVIATGAGGGGGAANGANGGRGGVVSVTLAVIPGDRLPLVVGGGGGGGMSGGGGGATTVDAGMPGQIIAGGGGGAGVFTAGGNGGGAGVAAGGDGGGSYPGRGGSAGSGGAASQSTPPLQAVTAGSAGGNGNGGAGGAGNAGHAAAGSGGSGSGTGGQGAPAGGGGGGGGHGGGGGGGGGAPFFEGSGGGGGSIGPSGASYGVAGSGPGGGGNSGGGSQNGAAGQDGSIVIRIR